MQLASLRSGPDPEQQGPLGNQYNIKKAEDKQQTIQKKGKITELREIGFNAGHVPVAFAQATNHSSQITAVYQPELFFA